MFTANNLNLFSVNSYSLKAYMVFPHETIILAAKTAKFTG